MISSIRAIFYALPSGGEIYRRDEDNPFESDYIIVLDAKDGYVQFRYVWRKGPGFTVSSSVSSMQRWVLHAGYLKVEDAAEWAKVSAEVARVTGGTNS